MAFRCGAILAVALPVFVEGVIDCQDARQGGEHMLQLHPFGKVTGNFKNITSWVGSNIASSFASVAALHDKTLIWAGCIAPSEMSQQTIAVLQMLSVSLVFCALVSPLLLCGWLCCGSGSKPRKTVKEFARAPQPITTMGMSATGMTNTNLAVKEDAEMKEGKAAACSSCGYPMAANTPICKMCGHHEAMVELEKTETCVQEVDKSEMEVRGVNELRQLLTDCSIDVSTWGEALLQELSSQLERHQCQLMRDESGHLIRNVNLLIAHVVAEFPGGVKALKCVRQADHTLGTSKAMQRSLARKLRFEDDADDDLISLMRAELELSPEWQREHLQLVWRTTASYDSRAGEFGQEFDGLTSKYDADEMWLKVVRVVPEDPAWRLPLPSGEAPLDVRESTSIKDITRSWQWVTATEKDLPPPESLVFAASPASFPSNA